MERSSSTDGRFDCIGFGLAPSLYISASSLGMFGGAPLWGFMADETGYRAIFSAEGA